MTVSASVGQKHNFCAKFDIWGYCTYIVFPMRAKFGVLEQTSGIRVRAKLSLDRFILACSGSEYLKILRFLDLGILCVASWRLSKKTEHECTTTNRQRHRNQAHHL